MPYLKQVGGKSILGCGFDLKKLPVNHPRLYEECLQSFAEHSVTTAADTQCKDTYTRANTIVWNNKYIYICLRQTIFPQQLIYFKKGIVMLEDPVNDRNDLIVKQIPNE